MEFATIILARGGSKGIKRKNIQLVGGKPMLAWSIEASLKSKANRTFVSTEDPIIKEIALEYGAEIIDRPEELAADGVLDTPVFVHALKYMKDKLNYIPDYVIHLRPNIIARSSRDINKAIDKINITKADGLRSVIKILHPLHFLVKLEENRLLEFNKGDREAWDKQRQQLQAIHRCHGIVDITKPKFILNSNFWGPNLTYIILDEQQEFDIHTEMDLFIVDMLIKQGYLDKWLDK